MALEDSPPPRRVSEGSVWLFPAGYPFQGTGLASRVMLETSLERQVPLVVSAEVISG